jgi:DNA-binding CsgD family transcriptional regulator
VILDDVQWADAASLQLLRFLARDLRELPVAVIATYREPILDASSSFAQALDELHAKRLATEIELEPFSVDAVEALLHATSGRQPPKAVVSLLHAETNGNAFFIEELYRHLAEEGQLFDEAGDWRPARRIDEDALPKGLRLVIEHRLSRLETATRRTLNAAAILGTSFDVNLLETVSATSGDQLLDCLDEAERAQIVRPDADGTDERFRFAHPLMRAAIVSALTSSQRQRLHVRAAAAIEDLADRSRALTSELARHYQAAGRLADPQRTIAALRSAGCDALDTYANVEAIGHLEAALNLAERLPGFAAADLADIIHHRGQAQYRLGDWSRSRESLDRALALYTEAGYTPGQAQVLYSKSSLATFDSTPSDALLFLAQARDLMPDDEPRKALVLQLESQNLVDLRRYADAALAVDEALAIADRVDDAYARNHARFASGYFALTTLDMPRAVDDFTRVFEARVALQHERMAAASRRALALACMGGLDAAAEGVRAHEYFRSMREADDVFSDPTPERDPYEFGLSCMAEGITAIVRGRFSDAYEFVREAIEACGNPPNIRVVRMLTPTIVQALYHLGRYDEAVSFLQLVAGPANGRRPAFWRLYQALEAVARGDDAGAGAELPVPPPHHPDLLSLPVAMLAAETAVARRDADAARLQVEALEFLHEHGVVFTPGWVVLTSRLLGAVYALIGNELRAAPMLETALSVARAQGASAELALTHLELAELHAARADAAASRTDLAEAEKLFSALGMRSCGTRVRALALRLESVAPAATGLTEQEADILRAIAAGLSNRAIALERSRSEDAIQRQITALYRKIGVENRAAAIAYAYRKGIAGNSE